MAMRPKTFGSCVLDYDQLLVDAIAGARQKACLLDLGAHRVDLGAAPPVALLDAGAKNFTMRIEQHGGRQHAGDADGLELAGGDAAGLDQFTGDGADVVPPFARILLGPASPRPIECHRARSDARLPDPEA